ncbi:transposase domain-containing protein [Rhizobium leguminosarum]|uniref:transposase domain-containing protein n=1 Tax=Rhizobium leguminosarum TaxID=384 RepID=UPI003F9B03BE
MPAHWPHAKEHPKLNAIDPFAYLTSSLTAIVSGPKHSRIAELLSWTNQNDAIA